MKSLFRMMIDSAGRPTGNSPLDAAARAVRKAVARALIPPTAVVGRPQGTRPQKHASSPTTRTSSKVADDPNRAPVDDPARPQAASFTERSATHAGSTRTVKLFVPTTLAPRPSLVVMLHGCTQDADDFARGTRMNEWAEREGFLVLYPNQSRAANPAGCWNWFRSEDQRRGSGEAAFIAEVTRETIERHGVDPRRVYVAGLSAGGAMAAILVAAYPDLYAAAAIHSGLAAGAATNLPDALSAMRRGKTSSRRVAAATSPAALRPVIVFHGDADTTVHPSNADQIVAAQFGGAAPAAATAEQAVSPGGQGYERTVYRDEHGIDRIERWVLHGAGHAWSGGDARGTYTDARGVDATREMLRFFAAHPRI